MATIKEAVAKWKKRGSDPSIIMTGVGTGTAAHCRNEETASIILQRVQAYDGLVDIARRLVTQGLSTSLVADVRAILENCEVSIVIPKA